VPGTLMAWFVAEDQPAGSLYEIGRVLLAISVAWQLFDAVGMAVGETLRAAGDTLWVLWARIAVAWLLFVPGAAVGVMVLDGGPVAAIVSLVLYLAVLSLVLYHRFRTGAWREIDLTGSEPTVD
jgi:MATE family multidrug resistance protein